MCTHFMLSVPAALPQPGPSGSPTYVTARCLELSGHMPTSLYLVPRGQSFPLVTPPPSLVTDPAEWTSQYGFAGVATDQPKFESMPCFMDGVNEAGLSMGSLWFPGTVYPASGPNPQVYFADFGAWILGNSPRWRSWSPR